MSTLWHCAIISDDVLVIHTTGVCCFHGVTDYGSSSSRSSSSSSVTRHMSMHASNRSWVMHMYLLYRAQIRQPRVIILKIFRHG